MDQQRTKSQKHTGERPKLHPHTFIKSSFPRAGFQHSTPYSPLPPYIDSINICPITRPYRTKKRDCVNS